MIVYLAVNRVNGKAYVGQTSRTLNYRRSGHKNVHRQVFHTALRKHGFDNFNWAILDQCETRDELNTREQYWIERLGSIAPVGYNVAHGGGGTPGVPLSESHKERLAALHRGKPSWNTGMKMGSEWSSPDKIEKRRAGMKARYAEIPHHMLGKTIPPEVRAKMSASGKGKNAGEKNGMYGKQSWMLGRNHTDEANQKNRESAIERWKDPGFRERQRISHLGIAQSEDTRIKRSESLKKFHANKRGQQ